MFVPALFNGIAIGMAYATVAVGYSMVFGILRLINFSHGSIYAFGAMMVLLFFNLNIPIIVAIVIALVLTGALAIAINKVALEPLRKKRSHGISSLITTIGLSYVIQNVLIIAFGSNKQSFPNFMNYGSFAFGTIKIRSEQLVVTLVSLILLVLLSLIVSKTKIGLGMRAVQQNYKAANLMGINVKRVISFTFFLGGASAAVAGALLGGYYQIAYPMMGFMLGLKAFAASVLGGIGVLHGCVVGGIVVGVAESLAATYVGGSYRDMVGFVILIIVLLFRPNGLFGKQVVEKV